jgi:glucosyl-3-phosphoglycerate synthase
VTLTRHHADFPLSRILEAKRETVTVCLPAREVAATIEPIIREVVALREAGVVDQVLVVDAASEDGSAELAARAGAEVVQENDLLPEFGPSRGKGDAMWRGLSACRGDIVVYVDSDSEAFGEHFVRGLVGTIVCEPGIDFVKGFYRRPFRMGDAVSDEGGGRVTELTARPLLRLFWPELAELRQPLAGELAARRSLLERIPFPTGYAIETTMLLDVHRLAGADAIAQVDLEVRQNAHQPLAALGEMASSVLEGAASRLRQEGRLVGLPEVSLAERPPLASLRMAA